MQNAKIFKIVFSSIQNAEFIALIMASWGSFRLFYSLETKIQNWEDPPFCQKNCIMFSSIMQNNKPKHIIF